jgi:ferritin-like metal-binding protein YciE
MKLSTLEDLLIDELKDLYDAEKRITKALPRLAKQASSEQLADGFRTHLEETKTHINRLEQIFEELGKPARGKHCDGIVGILDEGKEIMDKDADPAVKDAALIAAAQRVEHYEMAGYGCVRTWAELLGRDHIAQLLQQTLNEEKATDEKLTELARTINREATIDEGSIVDAAQEEPFSSDGEDPIDSGTARRFQSAH